MPKKKKAPILDYSPKNHRFMQKIFFPKAAKVELVGWICLSLVAACQSRGPIFSDDARSNNPVAQGAEQGAPIEDRMKFLSKHAHLLGPRLMQARSRYPSLEEGPSMESEGGQTFWWEDFWAIDFERHFLNPADTGNCLSQLSVSLESKNSDSTHNENPACTAKIKAFQESWSTERKSAVHQLISLRPTFYTTYQRSLLEELTIFNEAYRMQFGK
jgi:hypothetical protein